MENTKLKLSGKTAIITGGAGTGAGGTGGAITTKLALEGASVVIADINEAAGAALAKQLTAQGHKAIFVKCDVTKEADIINTLKKTATAFGGIDILVNNAYAYDPSTILTDISADDWDKQFAINIRGHFLFTKHAVPYLTKHETSSIINISSCASISNDDRGTAYGCAKSALSTLSGYTAVQFGRKGLRCNAILPGLLLSDEAGAQMAKNPAMSAFFGVYDKNILINRHGSGRDIANLVAFLASDDAGFITGAKIVVDGGMSAHAAELSNMRELTSGGKS